MIKVHKPFIKDLWNMSTLQDVTDHQQDVSKIQQLCFCDCSKLLSMHKEILQYFIQKDQSKNLMCTLKSIKHCSRQIKYGRSHV